MIQEKRKWLTPRGTKFLLYGAIFIITLAALFSGLLVLFIVPAPNAQTAVEVSGPLYNIGRPHPQYGDLVIHLSGGRSYYVNRVEDVPYFEWQRLLDEVKVGDIVTLTVVRPLAWRLAGDLDPRTRLPVAGVRTDSTIYMDPAIPAQTWTAQPVAVRNTLVLLALLAVLLISSRLLRNP